MEREWNTLPWWLENASAAEIEANADWCSAVCCAEVSVAVAESAADRGRVDAADFCLVDAADSGWVDAEVRDWIDAADFCWVDATDHVWVDAADCGGLDAADHGLVDAAEYGWVDAADILLLELTWLIVIEDIAEALDGMTVAFSVVSARNVDLLWVALAVLIVVCVGSWLRVVTILVVRLVVTFVVTILTRFVVLAVLMWLAFVDVLFDVTAVAPFDGDDVMKPAMLQVLETKSQLLVLSSQTRSTEHGMLTRLKLLHAMYEEQFVHDW